MSIPLIQETTKDAINTSIIAIKRNIERINMLLGLVDNDSPDLSGLATKQELEDAITQVETDLAPVDEVTSGNMQSVTSNAVANYVDNRGIVNAPYLDSGDFNTYTSSYLPGNKCYYFSMDINNFSNRPVTGTSSRRPALLEVFCITSPRQGTITRQKLSFCDLNGAWYYYEYERVLIDETFFSWKNTRAIPL